MCFESCIRYRARVNRRLHSMNWWWLQSITDVRSVISIDQVRTRSESPLPALRVSDDRIEVSCPKPDSRNQRGGSGRTSNRSRRRPQAAWPVERGAALTMPRSSTGLSRSPKGPTRFEARFGLLDFMVPPCRSARKESASRDHVQGKARPTRPRQASWSVFPDEVISNAQRSRDQLETGVLPQDIVEVGVQGAPRDEPVAGRERAGL